MPPSRNPSDPVLRADGANDEDYAIAAADSALTPRTGRFDGAAWRRLRQRADSPVLRNTGWLLSERVLKTAVSALVSAWVARYLGPTSYASIAFAMACVFLVNPLAQLGLPGILLRDMAQEPDQAGRIAGSALALRLTSGLVCYLGLAVFLVATQGLSTSVIALLIGLQLIFQSSDILDLWFQSRLESRFGVKARVAVTLVVSALKVVLILLKAPLWAFAGAVSLEFLLNGMALAWFFRIHPASARLSVAWSRARALAREGIPYIVSGLSIAIYMRVDQILLHRFASAAELGRYAAVVPLSQAVQMIVTPLVTSLAPVVARAHGESEARMVSVTIRMFRTIGALSLAAAIGLALTAPLVVPLLLGPAYHSAIPVLQIYAFTNVPIALGMGGAVWLATMGGGSRVMINTLIGSAVSLAINLALIPRFGALGAAGAAVISQLLSACLLNFITCRPLFWLQFGIVPKRVSL